LSNPPPALRARAASTSRRRSGPLPAGARPIRRSSMPSPFACGRRWRRVGPRVDGGRRGSVGVGPARGCCIDVAPPDHRRGQQLGTGGTAGFPLARPARLLAIGDHREAARVPDPHAERAVPLRFRGTGPTLCRCGRDACTPASSTAGADLPPAPPRSAGCGAHGWWLALHPQPSR
jgi:hypothetical protein